MNTKVLYISYDGALDPLGQSQVISYLKGLTKKGLVSDLVTFEKKNKLKKNLINQNKEDLSKNSISWHYLRYHKYPSLPATVYDIISGFILCYFLILKNKIKIVHVRSYVAMMIAYLLKKIVHIKIIFDMRGLWADERVDGGLWKKNGFMYRLVKKLEKKFLLNADEIIVLTYAVKDIIQNFSYMKNKNKNMTVIPTCTDLEKFSPKQKNELLLKKYELNNKKIIMYSGSLGTWYLLDEMIEFFKILKQKVNNAHFFLLLNNEQELARTQLIKQEVSDFTITSSTYQEMPEYLNLADFGLFFIKPSFSKKSSCATKFGEFLSCGIPVIINSGIGDSDSITEKNRVGVVVKDLDKNSYELAVRQALKLISDKNLKRGCRKVAENVFSLERGVNQYFEVYKRLLK